MTCQCFQLVGIVGDGLPAIGAQLIYAGLHPVKPAIVIGRHDLAGVGNAAGPGYMGSLAGAILMQPTGTPQGVLPVGGHQCLAGRSTGVRITDTGCKLLEQPGLLAFRLARFVGCRIKVNFSQPVLQPHGDEPQPQPAAQGLVVLQGFPKTATGAARHTHIDGVAQAQPVNSLVEQGQRKASFQLDNHRLFIATAGDHVGCTHLALDLIALAFQQGFDGRIKLGFA